jgi:hypothetical protein
MFAKFLSNTDRINEIYRITYIIDSVNSEILFK